MHSATKTIRLSAHLRQLAGEKQIAVDLPPGATVRELFQAIRRNYPALGDYLLGENGSLKPGMQMLVDGRHIDFLQGDATPVEDAADLFLIPPVFGG